MQKLLHRWYAWLGLVLLLGLVGSVSLICSGRGRITQANFARIQYGMTLREVEAIVGPGSFVEHSKKALCMSWRVGPDSLDMEFAQGKLRRKDARFATAWETLQWHAKKGAEKIGITWQ
jgi:hypothetical protein